VKCKSLLLYTLLEEGVVLVTATRGLPAIDMFGSWGLVETCEMVWRTR
jgi:hypothetical protein